MLVNSSRFGKVQVEDSRVITFPKGLLGFPNYKRFVLLQTADDSVFYWMQSADVADLAFVVADPSLFVSSYRVPLRHEQVQDMGMTRIEEAQVLVIVNKHGNTLTGNLQGPLVINLRDHTAEQLVLSDRRYHPRVSLIELGAPVEALSA